MKFGINNIKYDDTDIYKSKMATEQGLLCIGRALLIKEQEIALKLETKNKLLRQIQEYKTKSMLVSSLAVVSKVDKYLSILDSERLIIERDRDNYLDDFNCIKDELDNAYKEIDTIEEKISEYWKPRVNRLREKCINKNKTIKYMWYYINFINFITISMGFFILIKIF